jgi:uncharacterized membrane protein YeaQ/YmgE (transglycosylase-associated protein family)
MELLVWILMGGALGWISWTYLGFNHDRGAVVSTLIGGVGALVGGKAIAPLFIATPSPTDTGILALAFAGIAAAACLLLGDKLQRWGM